MSRPLQAHLNMGAFQHNLAKVREYAPNTNVLAMIKANGYGHGLVRTAQGLAGADALGVACIDEATQLREAGINTPIVLLEGFFDEKELAVASHLDLQLVIHEQRQLAWLENADFSKPITVWLKIDTGMHRLGFTPAVAAAICERLSRCAWVSGAPRLMTHFATSQDPTGTSLKQQLSLFNKTINTLPADKRGQQCLANSAAIMAWPETHADWVRAGIMLYGVSPFADSVGRDHDLQPVMTMRSELIAVHDVAAGEQVGYGGYWTCPTDMRVGIVAVGYGDGYPYHICQDTPVLVNGRQTRAIGRVSMDMIAVDLREHPEAVIGSAVTLWGEGLPVEWVARAAGINPHALLCGVAQRVKFNVDWSVKNEKENTLEAA